MKSEKLVSVEILMALIAVFIVSFVLIGVSTACDCPDFFGDTGLEIGTANPAAVYCVELGYQYNITTDNESGQRGICVFPDNSSCDAWDFFTGRCGANYSWCAVNGCDIKTMSDGRNQYSPDYAVCVLPETTEPVTKLMELDEKNSVGAIKTDYLGTNKNTNIREESYTAAVNPPIFSWRNKDEQDWITPVKDQASCGSCWAFGAVGGVEAKINIARNDSDFDPNLAEQHLVSDCCDSCGDCSGGSSTSALGFIKTEGISDEPCFPYTASNCPCSYRCSAWDKRLWRIDDYDTVPLGRENMKRYLIEKGPLVAYVCMNGYFDSNGTYRCGKSPIVNHAVVIVGYDDTQGCWIAKNSWGAAWNDHGYFKVGYGECGIEGYPLYIDLTKEQSNDFRATNIKIVTGSKSGDLNNTFYKDADYLTLSEKCYVISCDGLNAIIDLSVDSLQNITSLNLLAHHRARSEGGFSLQYWDENSDQWVSLGNIPDSTWYLMKYNICDSETECASYLSIGNISVKYYHPSCSLCDTDYVDIDWLYLEAYPEKLYCDAYTDNANFEWISRVALNTCEKISGSSTYSDYTTEVLTTLNRGETYTLQVDGHTTGSYPEFVKAWIDFNNDKDFSDADEEINLGNYTFVGNHTFNGQFNVPLDAVLSDTRMRVYLKYQSEPQACENASYGEVEDYKIRITSAALFTDNYSDYGIDVDDPPNGYYDYLAIDVGVNITESGYYEIYGSLYDELGSYLGSAYNYSYLNIGNLSVILKFDGINIRRNGVNGTYTLKGLRLLDDKYDELDYRYDAYTTLPYNYTDFEPSPAMFTFGFRDYGDDTNVNGLYDHLVIVKEVNVLKAGNYELYGQLFTQNGTYVDYDWNYTTLSEGLHNVSLKFRGWDIYKARENGNFEVSMYLYYYPPEGTSGVVNISRELDMASHKIADQMSFEESEIAFERSEDGRTNASLAEEAVGYSWLGDTTNTTSFYNYTAFEQPPGEFNNQFSDFGEDTDSDGLYNYLVINVGVKVNEAGDFRVRGYLYDEQSHQVDYDYNYTFLDTGNQTVQLKFEGIKIRQNKVNGTFDLSLDLYNYSSGDSLDYRYYSTSHFNYTDFQIPSAEFNDVYGDAGEDADGDGLFDYLVVNVGVDVREAGDYRLYGELYENGTYNYIDYDSNTTYLNEGMQTIQLRFEGIKIRNNEYNGTYDLRWLYLHDANYPAPTPMPTPTAIPMPTTALPPERELSGEGDAPVGYGEQLDYRYYAYTTSYYDYTEFQIPPAKFNDIYSDYGEDTDSDGLYDYLVINVSIDVREAGNYQVSGQLHENGTYDFVEYDSTTGYLDVGNQTIQLWFDAWAITRSGTFDLMYLRLYNATFGYGEQLDYRDYAYTTGYYEPLPRPALLNDVYSDFGEDTDDSDELYNYLVINVGVNVSEIGTYWVIGELHESGTYNFVDSASNILYLDHPRNQIITLKFEGVKIRNNEYNGTYDLRYLYLYDANYPLPTPTPTLTAMPTPTPALPHESEFKRQESGPVGYGELLDYRYYAYTTSYYAYTEFQPPIPDAYEPDDNYSLANYISVNGTKQTHDFHVPGDHDWLKFNATVGNAYTIETSDLGPESDTYLYLYGTDGTTEIKHDDDSGVGLASRIIWNCGASGTYYIMVRHYSSSSFGPETRYNISINYTILPARFNDVYSDCGLDTDSDGVYDYLAIDVGVNVSMAGAYLVSGSLYNSTGWYVDGVSNYTTLNAGNQTVQLRLNGARVWRSRTNGTFDLRYLRLYNTSDWSELDYRYSAYTTNSYNYTDFRPPAVFMPGVRDYGYGENGNGLYDYLVVEKQVNVATAGNYELDGYIINNSGYWIDSNYNFTYLSAGIHNLTLKFRGYKIYNSKSSGNFTVYMDLYGYSTSGLSASIDSGIIEKSFVENKSIIEQRLAEINDANISRQGINPLAVSSQQQVGVSSWRWFDSAWDITNFYSYTQFEQPPGEFNNVFTDFGEDTDSDGLYNYLVVNVGVNVQEAGDFEVEGYLYDQQSHQVDYDYNYTFLETGNKTVQLKFEGIKIRQNRVNGTFGVSLYLYQPSTGDTLDYEYNLTSSYNYTDFQIPPAEFNDVYSDYGEDADGDVLYNYLAVNVNVDVQEAGNYRVSGELYENGTYNPIDYDSNTTLLNEGTQIVQLRFEGIKLRNSEYNGTYDLRWLYLHDANYPTPPPTPTPTVPPTPTPALPHERELRVEDNTPVGYGEQLDYRYYAYTTSYYEYTEFQIPPAKFNDVYSDYGEDNDGDGLYDYLVVNIGVDVREAGNYLVSGELYENGTYNPIDYDSNTTLLNEGTQIVQLRFEGIKLRNSEYNGTYDLRWLYLHDANYPTPTPTPTPTATPTPTSLLSHVGELKSWESVPVGYGEQLDYRYYAYLTSYYHYTEFQPDIIPPVVTIISPVNGSTISTFTTNVIGFATDNVGIVKINVGIVEMSVVGGGGGVPDPTNLFFNYTVGLRDGLNTITVTASDRAGNSGNASVVVTCNYSREINANLSIDYEKREIAIEGKCTASDMIDIVIIGPEGFTEEPLCFENGFVFFNSSVDTNNSWNMAIPFPEGIKEGSYIATIYSPGIDGFYRFAEYEGGELVNYLLSAYSIESLVGSSQGELLDILDDLTVESAGSDDFVDKLPFNLTLCTPPNISWNVTISAINQLEPVIVGMHPNATDGYDPEFDAFVQTPVQGKVILLLDDIYSTSIKKTRCYDEPLSWNLTVGVPIGQTTTLLWAVPSNVNLTILDGDTVLPNGTLLGEGSHELTVIAELLEYQVFCIDLKAGWNMVSIPIIPDNNSVQAIFGSIPTLATVPVKTWVSPLFMEVDKLEPKKGYWVFTPAATTICVTGKPITNTTLNLKAGWNMVGTVGLENMTIAAIPNQVSICPAVTWISPSFIETDIIEPGKAAWVFVTQNTIVTTGEAHPFNMQVVPLQPPKMTKPLSLGTTEEWNLMISSTNQLEPVTFGLHPNATDNYDLEYDAFMQTPIQGKVILILDDVYAKEINKERTTWNLSVGIPAGATANLTWDSTKIPADINLTLDGTDMNVENSLLLGEDSHSFVIVATLVADEEPPAAPSISSSTHPNENLTYCNSSPAFSWTTPADPSGIACYSYALNHLALTMPDETCDTTGTTMSYTNLTAETWYFHVRAKDNADNWGPAAHYRIQIENCDANDGCYAYETGCEDRDYYCNGTSCTYSFSNRHTDYYDDWVYYCSGDAVRKHWLFHDFYCERGTCSDHTSWGDDQLVENCNNYDGWVDTGITKWVDDPGDQSKEKEQKEQEYHDYTCSNGSCVYAVTTTQWIDTGNTRDKPTEGFFDTRSSANPYPSIAGMHNGTIRPNETMTVRKLYTYSCMGTAGHSEYIAISYLNGTKIAEAYWAGYTGDWHHLTFNKTFTLYANETYNYTLRTASYPQIIHATSYNATGGVITCSEFVDINGKRHEGGIPAIRLE